MEPLHQPVALWMVGGGLHVLGAQQAAKGRPQRRRKLRPPVRGDGGWHPKACHSTAEQGPRAVCRRGGGQRDCLRPPRGAVNDGEEVRAAP